VHADGRRAGVAGDDVAATVAVDVAHMRGELWTIAREGLVYAFRCPPASSNTDTSKETAV